MNRDLDRALGPGPAPGPRHRPRLIGFLVAATVVLLTLATCRLPRPLDSSPGSRTYFDKEPEVTVLLNHFRGAREVGLESSGEVDLRFGASPPRRSERIGPVRLLSGPGGLRLGENHRVERISIRAARPEESVRVDGRPYRGWLHFRANGDGTLRIVNQLGMETYLEGVVASEMPASWPREALRAQAISARTYALDRIEAGPEPPHVFALDDSVYTMSYRGHEWVRPSVVDAVRSTAGIVLTWRGRVFRTYFHSTCGGRTADASFVFGDAPLPPLAGGVEDPYCSDAKYARWTAVLDAPTFDAAARTLGLPERPDGIEVSRADGGRATDVALVGPTSRRRVSAVDFRLAVGPGALRSTWWDSIDSLPDGLHFAGRGYGHGVGLCQHGAKGRSDDGVDAFAILAAFYPGAARIHAWPTGSSRLARADDSRGDAAR